ncbi:MAG: RHS repeat-associated core domain-containing protein, partial [Candidatus Riflebacteria bacterium]|nr:RHS repeat-associated core domain-containing protein [Candidatus Riflebacteria bacterium]
FGKHFAGKLTPYLYTGRRYSEITNQYWNRNRYYSPALGRFVSKDPTGFAADVNLYRYADGNPVIYTDPFGYRSAAFGDFAPERIGEEFGPSGGIGFGSGYGMGSASLGAWLASLFDVPMVCNPSNPANQVFNNMGTAGGKGSSSTGNNSYSGESGSPNGPDDPNWGNNKGQNENTATGSWGKGSHDSALKSAQSHFQKHGSEVGAKDLAQYIRKAEEFKRTLRGSKNMGEVEGYTEGVIRFGKNGRYIDLAPDGSIISFGRL